MKKGDKFLCKKSNKGHDNDVGVEKHLWYEVVHVDGIPDGFENIKITRYVQVNGGGVFNFSFCITHHNDTSDYIWDYFYTTKELRKLKLDKIRKWI